MEKLLGVSLVILWLQLASVNSQVEQSPQAMNIQEGENTNMSCSYKTSINNVQWYRQDSGRGLSLLILIRTNEREKLSGRLTATLDTSTKISLLFITTSQTADTAAYFCAVNSDQGLTFGPGTRLSVLPLIHQPDPSVYKLRGPKSSNTSVCLLTDFASQDNVTQEMKHMVFRSGSTALDVKAMDSKSNGALAWSNSINFQCNSTFETYAFYPSSEYSCDAKLVEKSFETDMNLNFQNLSVIALRILLLKVAGFNLLMTLRLWSS